MSKSKMAAVFLWSKLSAEISHYLTLDTHFLTPSHVTLFFLYTLYMKRNANVTPAPLRP